MFLLNKVLLGLPVLLLRAAPHIQQTLLGILVGRLINQLVKVHHKVQLLLGILNKVLLKVPILLGLLLGQQTGQRNKVQLLHGIPVLVLFIVIIPALA